MENRGRIGFRDLVVRIFKNFTAKNVERLIEHIPDPVALKRETTSPSPIFDLFFDAAKYSTRSQETLASEIGFIDKIEEKVSYLKRRVDEKRMNDVLQEIKEIANDSSFEPNPDYYSYSYDSALVYYNKNKSAIGFDEIKEIIEERRNVQSPRLPPKPVQIQEEDEKPPPLLHRDDSSSSTIQPKPQPKSNEKSVFSTLSSQPCHTSQSHPKPDSKRIDTPPVGNDTDGTCFTLGFGEVFTGLMKPGLPLFKKSEVYSSIVELGRYFNSRACSCRNDLHRKAAACLIVTEKKTLGKRKEKEFIVVGHATLISKSHVVTSAHLFRCTPTPLENCHVVFYDGFLTMKHFSYWVGKKIEHPLSNGMWFPIENLHFLLRYSSPLVDYQSSSHHFVKNDLVIAEFRGAYPKWTKELVVPFIPTKTDSIPYHAFCGYVMLPDDVESLEIEFKSFFFMMLAYPALWCRLVKDVKDSKLLGEKEEKEFYKSLEITLIHLLEIMGIASFGELSNTVLGAGNAREPREECAKGLFRYFDTWLKISEVRSRDGVKLWPRRYKDSMIYNAMKNLFTSTKGLGLYPGRWGVHIGMASLPKNFGIRNQKEQPNEEKIEKSLLRDREKQLDDHHEKMRGEGLSSGEIIGSLFGWITEDEALLSEWTKKSLVLPKEEQSEPDDIGFGKNESWRSLFGNYKESQLVYFGGCSGGNIYPLRAKEKKKNCKISCCSQSLGIVCGQGGRGGHGKGRLYNKFVTWENPDNQLLYYLVVYDSLLKESMKGEKRRLLRMFEETMEKTWKDLGVDSDMLREMKKHKSCFVGKKSMGELRNELVMDCNGKGKLDAKKLMKSIWNLEALHGNELESEEECEKEEEGLPSEEEESEEESDSLSEYSECEKEEEDMEEEEEEGEESN